MQWERCEGKTFYRPHPVLVEANVTFWGSLIVQFKLKMPVMELTGDSRW